MSSKESLLLLRLTVWDPLLGDILLDEWESISETERENRALADTGISHVDLKQRKEGI